MTDSRGDLTTLLWMHGLMLQCAAGATYQEEWAHYIRKATRVTEQISEHIVREEVDVGVVQG